VRERQLAQVTVTIAGKIYRMACGDGEEAHLENLATVVDAKIAELRGAFGEIGDQRLTVMAAIALADEASETRRKLSEINASLTNLRQERALASNANDAIAGSVAEAIDGAAARIERLAQELRVGKD
jgi:cell division protein ZapA